MVVGILTPFENNHGGGEVFIDNIVRFCNAQDDDIEMKIFSSDPDDYSVGTYKIDTISDYKKLMQNVRKVIKEIKIEKVTILILNDVFISQFAFIFKKHFEHVFSLIHGEVTYNKIKNKYISKMISNLRVELIKNNCEKILSVNHKNLEAFGNIEKIKYVGNFVMPTFATRTENEKTNDFLFVGRFVELKNINLIIDAFKMYMEKYNADSSLTLVGEGPELTRIQAYANEVGIERNVNFLGRVDHNYIEQLYKSSRCLLLFSSTEGFPTVVLESLKCGIPCVVSNVGSNNMIIQNGSNGYLFDFPFIAASVCDLMFQALSIKADECKNSCRDYYIDKFYTRLKQIFLL